MSFRMTSYDGKKRHEKKASAKTSAKEAGGVLSRVPKKMPYPLGRSLGIVGRHERVLVHRLLLHARKKSDCHKNEKSRQIEIKRNKRR